MQDIFLDIFLFKLFYVSCFINCFLSFLHFSDRFQKTRLEVDIHDLKADCRITDLWAQGTQGAAIMVVILMVYTSVAQRALLKLLLF